MKKEQNKARERLSSSRKKEIDDYIELLMGLYPQTEKGFNWQKLCRYEGIDVKQETFVEKFDALMVYDKKKKKFTIIVNDNRLAKMPEYRFNFTICHELGHYFLPEHRLKLEREGMLGHILDDAPNRKAVEEREADYFASHLLMPTALIEKDFAEQRFSLDFIQEVANRYKVSRDACVMRYTEIGKDPMILVYSEKGKIAPNVYHKKSKSFPFHKLRDYGEGRIASCCLASEQNYRLLPGESNIHPQRSNYKTHLTSDVFLRFDRNIPSRIHEFCVPMHEEGRCLSVFYF